MEPSRASGWVRVTAWLAAAAFLFVLVLRDLQLDRRLDVVARLDRATPYVSLLGPPVRVGLSADRVQVIGDPVYVNLRIPRWFRRATLELRYENPYALPLRVGVRTHPTLWALQFPTPSSSPPESGGGSFVLRVPFDLQRAWQVERNVYRFVLSTPGARPEQPLTIHALRVTAEREPICLGRLCV